MSLIGTSKLRGEHALFSPSTPSWMNYTDEQFLEALKNKYKAQIGTEIHEWSAIQIELGQKVESVRNAAKSIRTMIFQKYYSEKYGLSDFGQTLLENIQYVPADVYTTVKAYVNDSVSNFMAPEEILEYSEFFFGTADALMFDSKKGLLKIFDLKTGNRPAKIEQLYGYAALYCLVNKVDPFDVSFDLRIYQNAEVLMNEPESIDVRNAMDTIIRFDSLASKRNKGGVL